MHFVRGLCAGRDGEVSEAHAAIDGVVCAGRALAREPGVGISRHDDEGPPGPELGVAPEVESFRRKAGPPT